MNIYTSYFAKMNKIPSNYVPVAICAKKPDFYNGLLYKKLAPTYDIFMKYKNDNDIKSYMIGYKTQVLSKLNVHTVVEELSRLTNNAENIVLMCYEKSDSYCHRHFVADWLNNNGIKCTELSL